MAQVKQETGRGFTSGGVIAGTVNNTAVETILFQQTIPARAMGLNKILRFTHLGFLTTPALLVPNITLKIYLGASVVTVVSASTMTASQTAKPFLVEAMIANNSSTAAQIGFARVTETAATLLILSAGGVSMNSINWTLDTTVDQLFKVTVQFSAASTGTTLTNGIGLLELT